MAVLLALGYMIIAALLHAVWCRLPPSLSSVPKLVVVSALMGVALAAHLLLVFGVTTATLAGLLVYVLAVELYLFMATLVFGSVSAIWLRRLRRGRASVEQMRELYSPGWMVETRLARLEEHGFISRSSISNDIRSGDRFQVTPKGLGMIRTFGRLRAFFGHDRRPGQH